MSVEKARDYLRLALAELDVQPPATPPTTAITTPGELDVALAKAGAGDTLLLDPTLVYPAPLKLTKPVTLQSAVLPIGRMAKDFPAPLFKQGVMLGDGARIVGLDIRHGNPLTDIVVFAGAEISVDRCRILGDPVKGAKRGVAANGDGNCRISRSYIDDCLQAFPGNDSQAICAWDMAPGLLIEDNYLCGGSETIMIGGADPASADRLPSLITIRGNTITKNPAWKTLPVGVKNALELKNAMHVVIEDNAIEYSWGGHGQDGYLLMLTVRNQGGKAAYSTIEDVTIRNNRFAHGAAAVNILGRDNNNPSGVMRTVSILDNVWTDLDPTVYEAKPSTGSRKLIQIAGGPMDLTIARNQFATTGHTAALYFAGLPPLQNFVFSGNTMPRTKYGIFGNNATVGQAWAQYVASGTNGPNTEV